MEQPLTQAAIQALKPCVPLVLGSSCPYQNHGGQGARQLNLLKFVPRSSCRDEWIYFLALL